MDLHTLYTIKKNIIFIELVRFLHNT